MNKCPSVHLECITFNVMFSLNIKDYKGTHLYRTDDISFQQGATVIAHLIG